MNESKDSKLPSLQCFSHKCMYNVVFSWNLLTRPPEKRTRATKPWFLSHLHTADQSQHKVGLNVGLSKLHIPPIGNVLREGVSEAIRTSDVHFWRSILTKLLLLWRINLTLNLEYGESTDLYRLKGSNVAFSPHLRSQLGVVRCEWFHTQLWYWTLWSIVVVEVW